MRTTNKLSLFSALLALPFAALLGGCGGTSEPDGPQAPVCMDSTVAQNASDFCAPGRVAAGQPLTLQIRESCGGCTQTATHCEAVVAGTVITLSLLGQTCTLPANYACPAI